MLSIWLFVKTFTFVCGWFRNDDKNFLSKVSNMNYTVKKVLIQDGVHNVKFSLTWGVRLSLRLEMRPIECCPLIQLVADLLNEKHFST